MNPFALAANIVFPFLLYAETHYRIPGIPSRLFKREPEILIDVPHRVQEGRAVPVLLIIKDSDRFPVLLEKLHIFIDGREFVFNENQKIQQKFWHKIYYIQPGNNLSGEISVNAKIELVINQRHCLVHNDNFHTAGHKPFQVALDDQPLPGSEFCSWADMHCHSCYTNDQMEFGPPLTGIKAMSDAIGLRAAAVTDHSYDLDDLPDNYLINDPQTAKWYALLQEVERLNRAPGPVLIPGEELSVGNCKERNVHLLILNDPDFYHGTGDSGEKWLKTKPQTFIPYLLAHLSPQAAAFAAHPKALPPWPQRWLLGRDQWHDQDCAQPGLHGLQIWNGEGAAGFEQGLASWIRQLLDGRSLTIIGGNDSHGDFNRVRHIKIPFWSILESTHHVFGCVRTGLLTRTATTTNQFVQALRKGHCIISNGPFAQLVIAGKSSGETVQEKNPPLLLRASSTPNFGFLQHMDIYIGDQQKKQEVKRTIAAPPACLHFERNINDLSLPQQGYVRLQVFTEKDGRSYQCLTNPVYLSLKTI